MLIFLNRYFGASQLNVGIANFTFCSLANISPTIGLAALMAISGVIVSILWAKKLG